MIRIRISSDEDFNKQHTDLSNPSRHPPGVSSVALRSLEHQAISGDLKGT